MSEIEIEAIMNEYNQILNEHPNLRQVLTNVSQGKGIRLQPNEVDSYKRLSYLSKLLDEYIEYQNDPQKMSVEMLQEKYDKLMANASEDLKYAILMADSGHAISIPPNEVELYKQIRYINSLIKQKEEFKNKR